MPSSNGDSPRCLYAVIGEGGAIERMGGCDPSWLGMLAPGQMVLTDYDEPAFGAVNVAFPEDLDDERHYWKDGAFHEYPPKPGPWALWTARGWSDPRTAASEAAALEARRAQALVDIEWIRARARMPYITPIPGQDALYTAKYEEARFFLADPEPDLGNYPLIASEVGVTAPSAYEVAQIFANMNQLWRAVAGAMDRACFLAEAAVRAASSIASIDGVIGDLSGELAVPVPV